MPAQPNTAGSCAVQRLKETMRHGCNAADSFSKGAPLASPQTDSEHRDLRIWLRYPTLPMKRQSAAAELCFLHISESDERILHLGH